LRDIANNRFWMHRRRLDYRTAIIFNTLRSLRLCGVFFGLDAEMARNLYAEFFNLAALPVEIGQKTFS